MNKKRRVFYKRSRRRTSWRALLLSLVPLFASAPAAVPKTLPQPASHVLPARGTAPVPAKDF